MRDRMLWRRGAMVTDGRELYEVIGMRVVGIIAPKRWLDVENCRTLLCQHFGEADIDTRFRLVRAAPAARQLVTP